jgi:hypothetical protein
VLQCEELQVTGYVFRVKTYGHSFNRIIKDEKGFCEERSDEAIFQEQPECLGGMNGTMKIFFFH